ncbi:MAG: hypothetical protein ACI361_03195 [Atopobiaceae bacterium]
MAQNEKNAEAMAARAQSYLLAQDECAELLFWARSQKGTNEGRFERRRLYLDSDTFGLAQSIMRSSTFQAQVWLESEEPATFENDVDLKVTESFAGLGYTFHTKSSLLETLLLSQKDALVLSPAKLAVKTLAAQVGPLQPKVAVYASGIEIEWDGMKMRLVEHLRSRESGLNLSGDAGDEALPEGSVLFELPRGGVLPESLIAFLGSHELMPLSQSGGQLMASQYMGRAQEACFESALAL